MKLTNLSKILIVLALMVILFFVFKKCIPTAGDNQRGGDNIEEAQNAEAKQTDTDRKNATFEFNPQEPANGVLKGVVELGAAGFNSFIINIDDDKNWKLEKAEWGNSLVYDGLASGEDISKGLKKYISDMLDYGVSGKQIHFVVSSGAKTIPATQKIIDELKKMNYVVNTVTPEQEAQFALKSVLPPSYESSAFVVDIGSGNTKLSWTGGNNVIGKDTYGAKYYKNNTADDVVYNETYALAKQVPLQKRKTCFIIGGVPFSLAKMDRKGDERYTVLRAPGLYEPEGAKMKSGLNIYKAIADGTDCDTFVFDWDSNFTIGFLLNL